MKESFELKRWGSDSITCPWSLSLVSSHESSQSLFDVAGVFASRPPGVPGSLSNFGKTLILSMKRQLRREASRPICDHK